jgi:hypothetical protein
MGVEPSEDGWALTVLLCDSAEVADGKLFVLGGGWSLVGPGPFIQAFAIKLGVPWTEANRRHQLSAHLVDEDERPVELGEPPNPVRFETQFEVGRPPGLPPGTPLDLPLAVNLGPMQIPPGQGYAWVFELDGEEAHRARFRTRPGEV